MKRVSRLKVGDIDTSMNAGSSHSVSTGAELNDLSLTLQNILNVLEQHGLSLNSSECSEFHFVLPHSAFPNNTRTFRNFLPPRIQCVECFGICLSPPISAGLRMLSIVCPNYCVYFFTFRSSDNSV